MKNFFSLDWFKSQRQIELENLKIEEQALKNKLLEKQIHTNDNVAGHIPVTFKENLYSSLKLINNVLHVIMSDGTVLTKSDATSEDFYAIKNAVTEMDIFNVMSSIKKDNTLDPKQVQERKVHSSLEILSSILSGLAIRYSIKSLYVAE